MRIAVCDDEQTIRETLETYLNEYFESRRMSSEVDLYASGGEFVKNNARYDLVFMDYELPDGNGIDFVKQIRQENDRIFIVFSTSYGEHVFESFSLNTFRYLLKPLGRDAVFETMDAFVKLYQTNRKIIINGLNKETFVDADAVMYIEAQKKYTLVRTTQGSYTSYKSISRYEAEINHTHFFRTHRSYIVNMKYISEIEKKTIVLSNGERIVISPRVYDAFLQSYMGYLKYKN